MSGLQASARNMAGRTARACHPREVPRNSSSVPGFPLICLVDGLYILLFGRLALFVYPRRTGCGPFSR
jgi:hypothetical protein